MGNWLLPPSQLTYGSTPPCYWELEFGSSLIFSPGSLPSPSPDAESLRLGSQKGLCLFGKLTHLNTSEKKVNRAGFSQWLAGSIVTCRAAGWGEWSNIILIWGTYSNELHSLKSELLMLAGNKFNSPAQIDAKRNSLIHFIFHKVIKIHKTPL